MKEIVIKVLEYLLIPVVFGGTGAGVFFGLIKPQLDAGKILKKGAEAMANVIVLDGNVTASSSSGNSTREEQYYYLKLSFVNSEGDKIEYKTRSIYSERFINEYGIQNGEPVQVMYLGTKAVVKDFIPEHQIWLWVFPIVFGAIGAACSLGPLVVFVLKAMGIKLY